MKPRVMELLGLDHIPTMSEMVKDMDLAAMIKTSAGIFTGFTGKTVEILFLTGFLLYEQRYFDRKIAGISSHSRSPSGTDLWRGTCTQRVLQAPGFPCAL